MVIVVILIIVSSVHTDVYIAVAVVDIGGGVDVVADVDVDGLLVQLVGAAGWADGWTVMVSSSLWIPWLRREAHPV